eukprot:Tamp_26836.p1 GENE.Tamp_26836~~Tamp_26836.p1  ORF type:complete len:121 (-),score=10.63 Tamp_26836:83-445(-)
MQKASVAGLDAQLLVQAPRPKTKNRPDSETAQDRNWFGMKASPMDHDNKYTLALLANRNAIDPKRHYRKEVASKTKGANRLFQVGTILQVPPLHTLFPLLPTPYTLAPCTLHPAICTLRP